MKNKHINLVAGLIAFAGAGSAWSSELLVGEKQHLELRGINHGR